MTTTRLAWRESVGAPPVEAEVRGGRVAEVAVALFPDLRVEPSGGPPDLSLAGEGAGFRLEVPAGRTESESLSDALVHFEMALAEALIRSADRVEAVHAGGVEAEDGRGAVLFSGYGGAGKSTLTVALAHRGRRVYGDDVVLIERDGGRVRPFKRLLKLPEGSRRALGLPRPSGPLTELWPEASFYSPADLGSRWASPAPVARLVFPRFDPELGRRTEVRPLAGGETVGRLLRQILLVRRPGALAFRTVSEAVADATFHELRYGDATDVVSRLEDDLAGASP